MNPKTEFKRMWTSDLWTSDQFCLAYKQDGDKAEIKRKRQFGICFEAKLARVDMIATEIKLAFYSKIPYLHNKFKVQQLSVSVHFLTHYHGMFSESLSISEEDPAPIVPVSTFILSKENSQVPLLNLWKIIKYFTFASACIHFHTLILHAW